MLDVSNLNYDSQATILFQRLSVIVTDLLFAYAVKECCLFVSHAKKSAVSSLFGDSSFVLSVLLLGNFGLLIVDHIHFQYNGFLSGMLMMSIVRICQDRILEGALWFAVLLNFKHIYIYVAPAFIIYLLRSYCFTESNKDGSVKWFSFSILRLAALGFIVISVTGISFGPFIAMNQLPQVLSRLFPFKRGLCHAYWAPNFWALYNIADKVLFLGASKLSLSLSNSTISASMTGGLVQEFQHSVLSSVPPLVTFILTVLTILPAVYHLWRYSGGSKAFIRCLVLCAYSSFLFGWHVHEKAILIIIIPLSLLAVASVNDARVFLILSTVGHYSLFPLLFTPKETPIKVCLFCTYTLFTFLAMNRLHKSKGKRFFSLPLLSFLESLYLIGLIPLFVYTDGLHILLGLSEKLAFLPLLMTSVYCALGVMYSWVLFYWNTIQQGKAVSIHLKKS